MNTIKLGLGLVSIGRRWGVRNTTPPPKPEAIALIHAAHEMGIRLFDTAPAYNTSEAILGEALNARPEMMKDVIIATKAGEHWVAQDQNTEVDHSYNALCRSIDRSLDLLGRIDVLQVHKATEESVRLADVERAILKARSCGIPAFGASVSSETAAHAAIETGLFDWLQFPLNSSTPGWLGVHARLAEKGMRVLANRPFAMGEAAQTGEIGRIAAFKHVLNSGLPKGSAILTGTSSISHLSENISSFRASLA
ncbi:aldo/keto reductase [Roseibium sp. RKSG952]|uniref:aldo/keto reductase n=1 Tax=Roseibium sp. RKSG952 TaxID=2529384 RepID=UPI0012BB5DA0|nr:aldo/keto reductase [Roseibium sp. RKSG952]MTH95630.1 aldo/keto reductase [Roseibium sp. RKSG952]